MTDPTRTTTCAITGRSVLINDCLRSGELRPSLLHFIQKRHPGLKTEDWISRAALPDLKAAYVEAALSEEIGELGELERNVIESLKAHEIISANPEEADDLAHRTFGERVADQIPRKAGQKRKTMFP